MSEVTPSPLQYKARMVVPLVLMQEEYSNNNHFYEKCGQGKIDMKISIKKVF